jgi:hypothetical protein
LLLTTKGRLPLDELKGRLTLKTKREKMNLFDLIILIPFIAGLVLANLGHNFTDKGFHSDQTKGGKK